MADYPACIHCGAPVFPGSEERLERQGGELLFCCKGCVGAYLLITGTGLGEYYARRTADGGGLSGGTASVKFDDDELARHVACTDGRGEIDILIDGIRCAACVWLNERLLEGTEGVLSARVNYATGRARVSFDPTATTPATIFGRIAQAGYGPRPYTHSAAEERWEREKKDLLIRFGTAFFLTMQLMAYSFALYAGYFQGISPAMKMVMQLFSLVVTAPVIFYSGKPFLAGAWRGLLNGAFGMDLLIVIGSLSSFLYSIYAMFTGGEVYFETAAMIVTLILAGRLLENAARRKASTGIERLLEMAPAEACRVQGDTTERVATCDLVPGDRVVVAPGERFPVDGDIAEGRTDVDESPATGEPMPVGKEPGASVLAGSINISGPVTVAVRHCAADSFVARVARLVEEAQSRKAPIQGMADRISGFFVPTVLVLAVATFAALYFTGARLDSALMTALAVVVIACPCALGLATPTAVMAGTGAAAAQGIIFKGGDILERLASVTSVVFDKTGTLTEGRPTVKGMFPAGVITPEEMLFLAASLELSSAHPFARGIVAHAQAHGMTPVVASDVESIAGRGVRGVVAGRRVMVGSRRFLGDAFIDLPAEQVAVPGAEEGTEVYLAVDGCWVGLFLMQDRLRESAAETVSYLRDNGIWTLIFSGDTQVTTARIGAGAEIEVSCGELTPEEKTARIEDLKGCGERVLMAGDGINDAAALSAADVGCAIAGGTDIAIETSDLVLAHPDLDRLITAHRLAVRTMAVIRQNLGWAFVYNLVGIPLAMTGKLTPIYAAAAMALSSLCVVGNSLRLLRGLR